MKKKLSHEALNLMSRNPNNWRGIFYFNRKDPRVIVPKQVPDLGWTLNFASPYSYVALLLIVLIIISANVFL